VCKAKELSDSLMSLLNQVEKECNSQVKNYSQYDLMTEDLLHRIELGTFNASEGYMLCKKLQTIRQERRIVKDELEPLQSLRNILQITNIKKTLHKAKSNIEKMEQTKQNRTYKPRVLKNLGFK
jgi:hypothetical protein